MSGLTFPTDCSPRKTSLNFLSCVPEARTRQGEGEFRRGQLRVGSVSESTARRVLVSLPVRFNEVDRDRRCAGTSSLYENKTRRGLGRCRGFALPPRLELPSLPHPATLLPQRIVTPAALSSRQVHTNASKEGSGGRENSRGLRLSKRSPDQ